LYLQIGNGKSKEYRKLKKEVSLEALIRNYGYRTDYIYVRKQKNDHGIRRIYIRLWMRLGNY